MDPCDTWQFKLAVVVATCFGTFFFLLYWYCRDLRQEANHHIEEDHKGMDILTGEIGSRGKTIAALREQLARVGSDLLKQCATSADLITKLAQANTKLDAIRDIITEGSPVEARIGVMEDGTAISDSPTQTCNGCGTTVATKECRDWLFTCTPHKGYTAVCPVCRGI